MGQSILVVDDDPGIRVLLERWLTAAAYDVTVAGDGAQAIAALEQRVFDLLLTDIIMPDREGIETLIEVRKRWPQCRTVAMSGGGRLGAEQFLSLAGHLGAHGTIGKPFKREALLDLLTTTLDNGA